MKTESSLILSLVYKNRNFRTGLHPDNWLFNGLDITRFFRSSMSRYLCVFLLSLNAYAAEQAPRGFVFDADAAIVHDDNIFSSASDEEEDIYYSFAPEIALIGGFGKHEAALEYDGNYTAYTDNSDFNYANHSARLRTLFDLGFRLKTEFILGYDNKFEEPGSTDSINDFEDEFNQFENKLASARFAYGDRQSKGQLILRTGFLRKEFLNNQQEFRDYDRSQVGGGFFYRVGPKTRLLLLDVDAYRYDHLNTEGRIRQDSTELFYFTGVEWEATASTTGTLKVGYQTKNYESSELEDNSGLSYFADIIWKPSTLTELTLAAERRFEESSAQSSSSGFTRDLVSLGANHELSARIEVTASAKWGKDDIRDPDRKDIRKLFDAGIIYDLTRWLDIGLLYTHENRSSDDPLFDYTVNTVSLVLSTKFN